MQDGAAKAQRYRGRAKRIRLISDDVRSAPDRKILSDVAKDYDEMAKVLERPAGPGTLPYSNPH